MRIGVPAEVKPGEHRVAITPAGVAEFGKHGHEVFVQQGAGEGSLISDADYAAQGATVVPAATDVWDTAELVLKVKEPMASEFEFLRDDLALFTYLHLAADRPQTEQLLRSGTTALAYETVQKPSGMLPLLYPMSEVAGCLAPQLGANALLKANGGRGVLLGGVGGIAKAKVVVLGGGVAGQNAAAVALGIGAQVTVLDTDLDKLRTMVWQYNDRLQGIASNAISVREYVLDADLVIGTVLIPGSKTPKLVTNDMIAEMKPGSVLVDVAIDQGGCFADSHPTTHDEPTFTVHNSIFYCVGNIPGAVPNTATWALTNATLPYAVQLADKGWRQACRDNDVLARGLNIWQGNIVHPGVEAAFADLPAANLEDALWSD